MKKGENNDELGLVSSSPFLISYRTRQRPRGSSSSSLAKNMTMKWGLVVVFSCRRQWRALAYHCFLVFCMLPADNDDELKVHCRQIFFPVPAKDDYEPMFVVIFFFFCLCAPRENDELVFVIVFFYFLFVHLENMTTSQCSSSSFFFCLCAPRKDDNEPTLIIIFFLMFLCT